MIESLPLDEKYAALKRGEAVDEFTVKLENTQFNEEVSCIENSNIGELGEINEGEIEVEF